MYLRPLTSILKNYLNRSYTKQLHIPNNATNPKDKSKEIVIMGNTWAAIGLASIAVQNGHVVNLVNTNPQYRMRQKVTEDLKSVAKKRFKGNLVKQDKFISESMERLQMAQNPAKFMRRANVVIDAINASVESNNFRGYVQVIQMKRRLLKHWSKKASKDTIYVFAQYPVSPEDKADFSRGGQTLIEAIGHPILLFNSLAVMSTIVRRRTDIIDMSVVHPLPVYKLAELRRLYGITNETINKAILWLKEMDITGVVVQQPGDIKNSMIKLNNLLYKVESGSMTVSDIDLVTKIGSANHSVLWIVSKISLKIAALVQVFMMSTTNFDKNPIGPFEMADFIGLDKAKSIIDEIHTKKQIDGGEKYKQNMLLKFLISEGKLGRKTGEGFYTYNKLACGKTIVLDKSRHTKIL